MKILIICTFLFLIILYIDIKMYGWEYDEKENKRMEKEDKMLNYLAEKYDYLTSSIIKESIEEIIEMDLHNEEDVLEQIQEKILNKFESLLLETEEEATLKKIDNETIKSYIASKIVVNIEISKVLDSINSNRLLERKNDDIFIATEKVSNNTKVDSSVTDISDDLNNIFFGQ